MPSKKACRMSRQERNLRRGRGHEMSDGRGARREAQARGGQGKKPRLEKKENSADFSSRTRRRAGSAISSWLASACVPVEDEVSLVHDGRGEDAVPRELRHGAADGVVPGELHDGRWRARVQEPAQAPAEQQPPRGVDVHDARGGSGLGVARGARLPGRSSHRRGRHSVPVLRGHLPRLVLARAPDEIPDRPLALLLPGHARVTGAAVARGRVKT